MDYTTSVTAIEATVEKNTKNTDYMKRLFFLLAITLPLLATAQSRIYKGNSTYSSDVILTFDGKYIYNGKSTYSSDAIATFDGKYIYKGRSTYSSDVMFTYDGRHIYKGRSTYSSDILYTVKGRVPIALLLMIIL